MKTAIDFRQVREAWLSPSGEIRGCWPNHEGEAFDILREIGRYDDYQAKRDAKEVEYAYEYLESLGWMRLHAPTQKWIANQRPTARQRKVIRETPLALTQRIYSLIRSPQAGKRKQTDE